MSRNIILCADGTGNKGGYTPDSNVFKTYNAIELHDPVTPQISFYDNGVGTSTNKFLKALSAALGFGFQRNVCELYAFLCKNYRPDRDSSGAVLDRVYLFGFSRGAATIRALNGLIHDCGLIDARDYQGDPELMDEAKALIKTYLKARHHRDAGRLKRLAWGEPLTGSNAWRNRVEVKFIGVWDTVAALGMPKRTDNTGPVSRLLNGFFNLVDGMFNAFYHHREYNFQLTPNVERACHALSIDDERTAFWPRIWNECSADVAGVSVDQVWFAGMHADVGGGYRRWAMSNVSLEWILLEANKQGLRLIDDKFKEIRDSANAHDKMHDSRDGFGIFYRYHPRDLKTLCVDEYDPKVPILAGEIKVHRSVLSRMYHRTAGYAPNLLPRNFDVVDSKGAKVTHLDVGSDPDWYKHNQEEHGIIKWLKDLYIFQLMFSLFVLGYTIYLSGCDQIKPETRDGIQGFIADSLQSVLPGLFDNLIELWVNQNPQVFALLLLVLVAWWTIRSLLRRRRLKHSLAKRKIILDRYT